MKRNRGIIEDADWIFDGMRPRVDAKENVTPAELQQAKALVLRQLPLGEPSEDAVAGGLLARAQVNLPWDEAVP